MAKLTPRQRAFIRKRTAHHDPDPSEMMGELNIVPFLDIVVNIIMFLLATTQAVLMVAELDARLPSLGRSRAVGGPDVGSTLNLSVTIVGNGIIVAGEGGKLQPGCNSVTSGAVITVPRTGDSYAWPQLTQCAERLKSRFPDETRVIVSADPDIEFQQVVGAMDALRANAQNDELFSEVMLSAGPRGN